MLCSHCTVLDPRFTYYVNCHVIDGLHCARRVVSAMTAVHVLQTVLTPKVPELQAEKPWGS